MILIYMNDIHTVSNSLKFIIYADDTTLTSPLCSFTHEGRYDVKQATNLINTEISKIYDWLSVNKLSLNASKTKYMIFHNYQKTITENDIPRLAINGIPIERVTVFNFLGITINEYMNWQSHSLKIANKISRTLGVMNCLKRYLPSSALKLMYDSLVLSHLQFGITCWGFEWERIFKLQKRALRIITNSKYNAHTEPLFKKMNLLKIKDIFDMQCMKFWHKFVNKKLPNYFHSIFIYNNELYDIETRNHDNMHLFPTRTTGAKNVLRHRIPEILAGFPPIIIERALTHSICAFASYIKRHLLESYVDACFEVNCYI